MKTFTGPTRILFGLSLSISALLHAETVTWDGNGDMIWLSPGDTNSWREADLVTVNPVSQVTVDANVIVKNSVSPGFASGVTCWLTDSPERQDIKPALRRMKTGSLRFPYGHLSDNYLWHDINAGDPSLGLRPIVATDSRTPANWNWATRTDGTFIDAMDFDEYMAICTELDIQPLVVVNILSHKYANGPTLQHLIDTAAAWVQYANDKGYNVAYWQIGNEIDHHPDKITKAEYVTAYHQVVDAMKAVDPTIQTGTGILASIDYMRDVISAKSSNVDFLSAHQYLFGFNFDTYEAWRDYDGNLNPNVDNALTVSRENGHLPILVTETNAYGTPGLLLGNSDNNFAKALCWFELLMQHVLTQNVRYAYYWGTSDPWSYSSGGWADDETYTLLKQDASLTMRAEVSKMLNEYVQDRMVKTTRPNGFLRAYSSINVARDRFTLFLMNKDTNELTTKTMVANLTLPEHYSVRQFSSDTAASLSAEHTNPANSVSVNGNEISTVIPPLSITAISFYPERSFDTLYTYLRVDQDDNGDGIPNYLSYAQGSEPEQASPADQLCMSHGQLTYGIRKNVTDVHHTLESSTDLTNWAPMSNGIDYIPVITEESNTRTTYSATITPPLNSADKLFIRQRFSTRE